MEDTNNTNVTTEATENTQEAQQNQEVESENAEHQPSIEELQARLAAKEAAYAKLKAANDKTSKSEAELKRQLREKMSTQEQEAAIKEEEAQRQKEYIESLEDYKRRNEAKERYMMQGMDGELAVKAADAEVTGDMDALADIQKQHTDNLLRAKEAEWKKSRPRVNFGDGSYSNMTREEIMAIDDRTERRKAIAANQELFTAKEN